MEYSSSTVNISLTYAASKAEQWNDTLLLQQKGNYNSSWWTIITFINLLLYILSVTGNCTLLSAYAKNAQMRTTTNMLVVSHLIAELAASSFGISAHVLTLIVGKEKPPLASVWCTVVTSMIKLCLGGGFLSLVGITVDRYLALVVKVHHKVTRRQVRVFLTAIWTLSIAYGIPWNSLKFLDGNMRWNYIAWLVGNCHVDEIAHHSMQRSFVEIFQYFFLCLFIVPPLFIIAFTGFHIFRTAFKARRSIGIIGINARCITAAYMKSAVTTILIISVYFLCVIPTIALAAKCRNRYWSCGSWSLFFFAKVTLCFRSACFPVIFAARNRNFSRYIRRLVFKTVRICKKCPPSRSNKVYACRNCSSSGIINGPSETTTDTTNLETHAFNFTRKLAFVDLENIAK